MPRHLSAAGLVYVQYLLHMVLVPSKYELLLKESMYPKLQCPMPPTILLHTVGKEMIYMAEIVYFPHQFPNTASGEVNSCKYLLLLSLLTSKDPRLSSHNWLDEGPLISDAFSYNFVVPQLAESKTDRLSRRHLTRHQPCPAGHPLGLRGVAYQ